MKLFINILAILWTALFIIAIWCKVSFNDFSTVGFCILTFSYLSFMGFYFYSGRTLKNGKE